MMRRVCAGIVAVWALVVPSDVRAEVSPFVQQAELPVSGVSAVAISGTTAIVGSSSANGAMGAAYVFVRTGTKWSLQQTLTASDGEALDAFASSVALSGTTAIIGATGKGNGAGGAYVFTSSGSTWSQQQELLASDGNPGDSFGVSVSLSASTVLIGAHESAQTGAAYVFTNSGSTWSEVQKLLATNGQPSDFFGFSVSLSGTTALIGAFGANAQAGSAYVFMNSAGTWSQQQEITASDAASSADFGFSVALSGTTAVVGAQGPSTPGAGGSAYVFVNSGGAWAQQQELLASDASVGNAFGSSVAITASTIFVGAPSAQLTGETYVFGASGSVWQQQQVIAPSDASSVGVSAAFDGTAAILGANNAAYVLVPASIAAPVHALGWMAPVLALLLVSAGAVRSRRRVEALN